MFSNSCNLNFQCFAPKRDTGSDSELLPNNMNREPVILNVYDMVIDFKSQHKSFEVMKKIINYTQYNIYFI